jgi:hypothetical protein
MKTKIITGGAGDVFLYVDLRPRKHLWVQFEANEVIQMLDEVKKYLDELSIEYWGKDEYEIAAKIGYSVELKKKNEEKKTNKN